MHESARQIERHKTAIRRPSLSLPVKCLLRDGLFTLEHQLLDFGCGRGQDLDLLRGMGFRCHGWDPVHRSDGELTPADVVNFGYVINVIEEPKERAEALRRAWDLCRSLLVVSAQVNLAAPSCEQVPYGDGVVTSRRTFQKYYTQAELRVYLEKQLRADAIPAAPGVFYLFKEEGAKQRFLASRYRRSIAIPPQRVSELLFEQNQDVLAPLMEQLTRLGRLPGPGEFPHSDAVIARLGSVRRAFALIQQVTDTAAWGAIANRRSEDLLVYLALARFHRRPPFSQLPLTTQFDVKAFFGTYERTCREADALLFAVGDAARIDSACQSSTVGRLVENALLVHRSALGYLDPVLRIYEGCARALVGEVDAANVIKLHRFSGKVSYLSYQDFEENPHPALRQRVKVALRTLEIDYFDYSTREDPFILFQKEALLHPEHPLAERFARLTRQEDKHGLLQHEALLDTRSKLDQLLQASALVLRGHRLCRPTPSRCAARKR